MRLQSVDAVELDGAVAAAEFHPPIDRRPQVRGHRVRYQRAKVTHVSTRIPAAKRKVLPGTGQVRQRPRQVLLVTVTVGHLAVGEESTVVRSSSGAVDFFVDEKVLQSLEDDVTLTTSVDSRRGQRRLRRRRKRRKKRRRRSRRKRRKKRRRRRRKRWGWRRGERGG